MKLSDHIKKHHNGTQSHFAAFHGIQESRVSEMINSDKEFFVLTYENEVGEEVMSIFRESRPLRNETPAKASPLRWMKRGDPD